MFKKLKTISSIIVCISYGFGQMPCESGFASVSEGDSFPCNDYDLISHIPISVLANTQGNPEGSDTWGWTDPLNGKEYAIVATTNSTAFVDISNAVNPIFLGRLDTNTSTSFWRDVKVYNNYAFIIADNVGAHGMQIFDLTILRDGIDSDLTFEEAEYPDRIKTYSGDGTGIQIGSCHNIIINESEAVAYLVGCNSANGGGPIFVDISDPISPTTIGNYTDSGYTHDAQVITYNGPDTSPDPNTTTISTYVGREILVASNGSFTNNDKLVFLDVTDKSNVVKISEITYPQPGYAHQGWFTEDHRYFIMGDETDEQSFGMNTRTLVFDVQDLDNPILSSTYFGPSTAIDHNGYVKGDRFYLANYRGGLRVLDISNIASDTNSMTEIGYFDTHPENDNTGFDGAWSVYPYFESGNIIISDIDRGLFVVRKSGTLGVDAPYLNNEFLLSPNPAKTSTIVSASKGQGVHAIEIYNILGKKVFEKHNINLNKFVIPTASYERGIYVIRINSTITKKLLLK
ncbi:regulator [Hanstruepera neustonica]|uniref:Regulator n=1 Tax=Hanstruepera neustonica TaxID=1445657 RepID=A0A2K1E3Y0_9FLAO|nr:choice-of-anchor B family protein [Hanstruepera neustonica]PNQ74996.1 regulator [Hanstruepera neustonica]